MAKIAVEFGAASEQQSNGGASASLEWDLLARGDDWRVYDVVCTSGPGDRAFEEQHADMSIAIVAAGSFQYRSSAGRELMTPGSLLLGNAGQFFECGHEHGVGDRCISFQYAPEYFEGLAAEARARRVSSRASGTPGGHAYFRSLRVPALRELSGLIARAWAGLAAGDKALAAHNQNSNATMERPQRSPINGATGLRLSAAQWKELSLELAARVLHLAADSKREPTWATPAAEARVTRVLRAIERQPDAKHELGTLARETGLSRYHFLRLFRQLTGLTPHQYILRARLRRAAVQLVREPGRITDVALDCGFGDVSNFNHAFRTEFGISPRLYRNNFVLDTRTCHPG